MLQNHDHFLLLSLFFFSCPFSSSFASSLSWVSVVSVSLPLILSVYVFLRLNECVLTVGVVSVLLSVSW